MSFSSPGVGFSKPTLAITHGVIRWDSWYGNTQNAIVTAQEVSVQYPAWLFRAPLHANTTTNPVTWADTQATFDNEINVASSNGIDYFVYLTYPLGGGQSSLNSGYNYHMASSSKNKIKFAIMRQASDLGTTGNFATQVNALVTIMQDAQYMKVLGSRPLLYIYVDTADLTNFWGGSDVNFAAMISSIRSTATGAGLANPYIVDAGPGAYSSVAGAASWGLDAVSNYTAVLPNTLGGNYVDAAAAAQAYWDSHFTANTIVPICMVGWDPRPRKILNAQTITSWFNTATLGEFTAHQQAARNYIRNNPTRCPAQTVLTYAWDECTEGGVMLCPTVGDPAGTLSKAFAAAKASIF